MYQKIFNFFLSKGIGNHKAISPKQTSPEKIEYVVQNSPTTEDPLHIHIQYDNVVKGEK